MKQRFADRLREIANQTSEEGALIQKLNSMFDYYAPELRTQIPQGVQAVLIKSAKKKQREKIISISNYSRGGLTNQKAITINDYKKDAEKLKNIFKQVELSSLVDYEKHFVSQQLEYKTRGDQYSIYLGTDGLLVFSIALGADSLAKVLQSEGFEVSVSISDSKKLLVKW